MRKELDAARTRNAELECKVAALQVQLDETMKLCELQQADLERYRQAYEAVRPNHPERVAPEQLQLAFEQMLAMLGPPRADNDVQSPGQSTAPAEEERPPRERGKKRHPHGRRSLDTSNLEKKELELIPAEVTAAGGVGWERIGEEVSTRVAFRAASYICLVIRRVKFVRTDAAVTVQAETDTQAALADVATIDCASTLESSPVVIAPLPDSVWPTVMADPSAIAHVIVSKYDDLLPLHRQERISARDGFVLPRSTQCGWLGRAHQVTYRIVDAMFADAKTHAYCIATDATGAPMRAADKCQSWDVFVLLADRDHIVFRYVPGHATSDSVRQLFSGFRGHLLADAAPIYDALYETGDIIEHCCWFHARRYFYRALETDRDRALEPLSLIAKLFEIDTECGSIPDPAERTASRARRCKPLLEMLDEWMGRHRDAADPRGPLAKAIGYYDHQRIALHRFVDDARISLHNNASEQQLRNLAMGRHNWTFFANETGLRWYTTFRSLIASCRLHHLNAERYLEEVLRLAPHWPASRVLELSPKLWSATRNNLDARYRAIITRPWEATAKGGSDTPEATSSRAPPIAVPA